MDQRRHRPAPGMMGQVSVAPLQRIMPSSHRMPKVGWMRKLDEMSTMPCSYNTCSASCRLRASWVGVLQASQRLPARAERRLAARRDRLDPRAQRKRIRDATMPPFFPILRSVLSIQSVSSSHRVCLHLLTAPFSLIQWDRLKPSAWSQRGSCRCAPRAVHWARGRPSPGDAKPPLLPR
jgi:hypothetical protein